MAKRRRHNHQKIIMAALRRGDLRPQPGRVTHLDVYHDGWCSIFKGGRCNCFPEIRQRPGAEYAPAA